VNKVISKLRKSILSLKASQDYLKAEKEVEDLEALLKVKKEIVRKANENFSSVVLKNEV